MAISILSILVIASFYSSSSTFLVFGKKTVIDIECSPQDGKTRCCGSEHDDEDLEAALNYGYTNVTYCTTCDNTTPPSNCTPREKITMQQSPTTPTTPTPPPLFGRNVENVQPTGDIEQPLTTTLPPIFGRNIPQGDGLEVLQESETPPMFGQAAPQVAPLTGENTPLGFFGQEPAEVTTPEPSPKPTPTPIPTPTPTPTPTPEPIPVGPDLPPPFPPPTPGFKGPPIATDVSPDLAPEEDDQGETDDGRNDIIPDTGIAEQPETQQPEEEQEEPSNEDEGEDTTAGPLT